jgi:hypothetical protein
LAKAKSRHRKKNPNLQVFADSKNHGPETGRVLIIPIQECEQLGFDMDKFLYLTTSRLLCTYY